MSEQDFSSDILTLEGKTALVTGGALRIGRAVVETLASEGVRVVIHFRNSGEDAQALADLIRSKGGSAWTLQGDFGRVDECAPLVDQAIRLAGPLDILVNSASIFPETTLAEFTPEDLATNMQVNALAPTFLARAFARQGRPGAIVNFLDTMIVDYDRKHVPYHLSKQALYSLTRMMAVEYAPLIRVNAVAPGLVLPPPGKDAAYLKSLVHTNPLQRYGSVEGIAETVRFLLRSGFITGQVVYVDGGRHLRGSMYG